MSTTDRVLGAIFDGLNDNFKQRIQTQRARKSEEYNYRRDLRRRQDNYDDLVAKGYYSTDLNDPNAVALSNGQISDVYKMTPLQYRAPKEFAPQKLDNAQIADKKYNDLVAKGINPREAIDIAYNQGRGGIERIRQQGRSGIEKIRQQGRTTRMAQSQPRVNSSSGGYGYAKNDMMFKRLDRDDFENGNRVYAAENNLNGIRAKNVSKTMFIDGPDLTKIEVPNPNYNSWLAEIAVAEKALESARINKARSERLLNEHIKKFYPDWNTAGGKLYMSGDNGGAEVSIGFEPREYSQNPRSVQMNDSSIDQQEFYPDFSRSLPSADIPSYFGDNPFTSGSPSVSDLPRRQTASSTPDEILKSALEWDRENKKYNGEYNTVDKIRRLLKDQSYSRMSGER